MRPFSFPTRTTAKGVLKRTIVIPTGSDHAHVILFLCHKLLLPCSLLIHTYKHAHYSTLIKQKTEGKKDSIEDGTDYELQKAKHYLTQELKELNNNKNLHPNNSARSCTNRIHSLFPVEGEQKTKTGQETFSIT
jgi:hypothetical protein